MNPHQSPPQPAPSPATTPCSEPWRKWLRIPLTTMGGRHFLGSGVLLTTEDRAAIAEAVTTLKSRLLCDALRHRQAVAMHTARLLLAFPGDAIDEGAAKVRSDAYWIALCDKPAWAIEETVNAILRGEEEGIGTNWSPTPPALATAVRKRTEPILADIKALGIVATAEVWTEEAAAPPPEQFVIDGFADLRAGLAVDQTERAKETHARFMADLGAVNEKMRIRDCQREGIDPALGVTPTLLRLLRQQPEKVR